MDRVTREVIELIPSRKDGRRKVGYTTQLAAPARGVRLKPTRRYAAMATVALVPWVLVAFLTLAVCVQRIGLVNDLNALRVNDDDLDIAMQLQAVAILIAGIFFVRWLGRARANADALGMYRSRWGHRWLVLAWVIPILDLWTPLRIVSDLWRGSDPTLPRGKWPRPRIVVVWWAAWLCYNVGFCSGSQARATEAAAASHIRTMAYFEIAAVSAGIIAALLAVVVVWRISLLQHSYRVDDPLIALGR